MECEMNYAIDKMECVFLMVVVSILPHVEFGANDHQEYALHFMRFGTYEYFFLSK